MNSIIKKETVKMAGADVVLILEDRGNGSVGQAIHTVSQLSLDDGTADGPCDGFVFRAAGRQFRLGAHDYDASGDDVTCTAEIYLADAQ